MLARVDWSNCSIEIMLPPLAMDRYDKRNPGAPMPKAASVRGLSQRKLFWSIPVMTPRMMTIVIHIVKCPLTGLIGFRHLAIGCGSRTTYGSRRNLLTARVYLHQSRFRPLWCAARVLLKEAHRDPVGFLFFFSSSIDFDGKSQGTSCRVLAGLSC